jgi:hypothetical protein
MVGEVRTLKGLAPRPLKEQFRYRDPNEVRRGPARFVSRRYARPPATAMIRDPGEGQLDHKSEQRSRHLQEP